MTSRPPLTPVRKQPGTAKSHSGRDTARVAGPLARRIEHRKAEKAMAKTVREAKKPKIPAFREENRPRDKKRQIPDNGGQNAPLHEKSPENRNAEKVMAKTVREAKKPQIPAFREENRPRDKKRQIPGNGGQNAPPDEKSPENRNTEKVIRKTPTPPGLC